MRGNVPTRNRESAAVPVGVGTRFVYDGEILTVLELFPTARLVEQDAFTSVAAGLALAGYAD